MTAPVLSTQTSPSASTDAYTVRVRAAVFEWPDHDAPVLRTIQPGERVTAYRKHKNWIRITPAGGLSEWLPDTVLAK